MLFLSAVLLKEAGTGITVSIVQLTLPKVQQTVPMLKAEKPPLDCKTR